MSPPTTQIEKLNKENYDTWKVQVEAILVQNDQWEYVTGQIMKPVDEIEAITWTKNDRKAKANIILTISPSELCYVKHCETSNEVWLKLREVYESTGPARKATLLKQLLFTKMTEGDNMINHLNNFFNVTDKLLEIEVVVSDDVLAILLLYSIPESYEAFRCAVEARDDLLKPEVLKLKLIQEANSRKEKTKTSSDSSQALYIKDKKLSPKGANQALYIKDKKQNLKGEPPNKNVVGSKWVLKIKYREDGTIERRKARLVARGFTQKYKEDYDETFAPVARMNSLRTLIAVAAEKDLLLYHLDVTMAYTYGELDEEIYMEQAKGFEVPDKNKVYKLNKSLYGLKQSGRQWSKTLDQRLKAVGLERLNTDKCIYLISKNSELLYLLVYVDDLVIATNSEKLFDKVKGGLSQAFKIKDLGSLSYCLGIEFEQDKAKKSISMYQYKYIRDVLDKYGMGDCKPVSTPMDANSKLSKATEEEKVDSTLYKSLVGSLMYLSVATRPDISYTVSKLSQFNNDPRKSHLIAAKRVLRYLQGTQLLGIQFIQTGEPLVGFVDADWGGDPDDRRSYSGYTLKLANCAISWESRKQRTVSLSSCEAEYVALSEIAKEVVYMRNLLNELKVLGDKSEPTTVYCDNQGAQSIVRNPVHHARTKHIDIRTHYVRQVFEQGELDVKYIPSENMIADVLTKGLHSPSHQKCLTKLGLQKSTRLR